MTLTKKLFLLALACVLISAQAQEAYPFSPPFDPVLAQDLVPNAANTTARRGGRNGKIATARTCAGNQEFDWPGVGCTMPLGDTDLVGTRAENVEMPHTMTWTLPASVDIVAGTERRMYFDGYRGGTLMIRWTGTPDPNLQIMVYEEFASLEGYGLRFNPDQNQQNTAIPDREFFVTPRTMTYFPARAFPSGNGKYSIGFTYWGAAESTGTIDMTGFSATLMCYDKPNSNLLAWDTPTKSCLTECPFEWHYLPTEGTSGVCLRYWASFPPAIVLPSANHANPGVFTISGAMASPSTATFQHPIYSIWIQLGSPHQSDKLVLSASAPAGGKTFGIMVGEFLSGYTSMQYRKELIPPFENQVIEKKSTGTFFLLILQDAIAGQPAFDPSFISGSLQCNDNLWFEGPNTYTDGAFDGQSYKNCAAPLPPLPEGETCAYNALGFNPWERWNIFSGGQSQYNNPIVEGRVASVGELKITGAANFHTAQETYKLPASAKWSVQAGSVVVEGNGVNAVVHNGGVDSQAATTIAQDKVDGEINVGALSVDLVAVKKYFGARSAQWGGRPDSVIDNKLEGTTLTLRLHGKVNFFTITVVEYANLNKILLTGHPVGTVIINVKGDPSGDGTVQTNGLVVVYLNAEGRETPLTFGRVLLNFYELSSQTLDLSFLQGFVGVVDARTAATQNIEDAATQISVLAPLTSIFCQSSELKGNIVAAQLTFGGSGSSTIKNQPFGTVLKNVGGQPRAPRVWTNNGKRAVSCLWHEL